MEEAEFLEMLRQLFEGAPFNRLLGVEIPPLRVGHARVDLPFKPELIGDMLRQSVHGGVLASLLDTTGGLAVWTQAGLDARLATIDLRVDYLKPAGPHRVVTEAKVLRLGNQSGVAEVRCYHPDARGQTLAQAIGVFNIARPKR